MEDKPHRHRKRRHKEGGGLTEASEKFMKAIKNEKLVYIIVSVLFSLLFLRFVISFISNE